MKKHITQMSPREIRYIEQRFKSVPQGSWSFNPYSRRRASERKVDMAIFRTLWSEGYDVIEFHQHEGKMENRILLRSIATDKKDNQVCAVFNFTTREVTTVYLNWKDNKHCNLVWEEYDKEIDIKEAMKKKHSVH